MIRKVTKVGQSSLCIALPSKWVKAQGIEKGHEVNLVEKDGGLAIVNGCSKGIKKCIFDTRKLKKFYSNYLHCLYKAGYDEIKILFNDPAVLELINKKIKYLMGFEIIDQTKDSITLRDISEKTSLKFDSVLRRSFLITLELAESMPNAIKNNDSSELRNIRELESGNNMFNEFLRRQCMSKSNISNQEAVNLFGLTTVLEMIADYYKYIIDYLLNNKKIKINDKVICFFKEVSEYIRLSYDLFYKFDLDKVQNLNKQKSVLLKKAHKLIEKGSNHEAFVVSNLIDVICLACDVSGPVLRLNFKDFVEVE